MVERAAKLMGGNRVAKRVDKRPGCNSTYLTHVAGARAEEIVDLVYPHPCARRRARIDEVREEIETFNKGVVHTEGATTPETNGVADSTAISTPSELKG